MDEPVLRAPASQLTPVHLLHKVWTHIHVPLLQVTRSRSASSCLARSWLRQTLSR